MSKKLVLWIVLILMFLAVYNVFTNGTTPPPPALAAGHSWWTDVSSSWGPMLFLGAIFLISLFYVKRLQRRVGEFNVATVVADGLLRESDPSAAVEKYRSIVSEFRKVTALRVLGSYNLARALLQTGDAASAEGTLAGIDADAKKSAPAYWPAVPSQRALAAALVGDVAAARRWLAEAEQRRSKQFDGRHAEGLHVLAQAVADLRDGRGAEALRAVEDRWRELEDRLPGAQLRPLRVVRAFATAQAGVRDAGPAERMLESVRPTRAGEFAWLGAAWPEMRAFLESHGV